MLIGYVQFRKLTGQVLQKSEKSTFGKILHILFIGIGLTFKTDVLVSSVTVPIKYRTEQPFRNVEDVKRQDQQFALLLQVDAFMVDEHLIGL